MTTYVVLLASESVFVVRSAQNLCAEIVPVVLAQQPDASSLLPVHSERPDNQ